MKPTTLFTKKLNRWLLCEHEMLEIQYVHERFYADLDYKNGFNLDTLAILCRRVEEAGCQVIGLESNIDVHNLYTEVYEEYCLEYQTEWWLDALRFLKEEGITDYIFLFVHVPEEILKLYR